MREPMTTDNALEAIEELNFWMNAIFAPRHQHKNLEIIRAAIEGSQKPLPEIETFSGHAHTLREDVDTLYARILEEQKRGVYLMHNEHLCALFYNLRKAVAYLEKIGIKSFGDDAREA